MSDSVILRSNLYKIIRVVKPTTAKFWRNRKEGQVIKFTYVLKDPGRNYGTSLYASRIRVNCGTDFVVDTPTNLVKRLEHFELEEIEWPR